MPFTVDEAMPHSLAILLKLTTSVSRHHAEVAEGHVGAQRMLGCWGMGLSLADVDLPAEAVEFFDRVKR